MYSLKDLAKPYQTLELRIWLFHFTKLQNEKTLIGSLIVLAFVKTNF
jgi:hypothetical protein